MIHGSCRERSFGSTSIWDADSAFRCRVIHRCAERERLPGRFRWLKVDFTTSTCVTTAAIGQRAGIVDQIRLPFAARRCRVAGLAVLTRRVGTPVRLVVFTQDSVMDVSVDDCPQKYSRKLRVRSMPVCRPALEGGSANWCTMPQNSVSALILDHKDFGMQVGPVMGTRTRSVTPKAVPADRGRAR